MAGQLSDALPKPSPSLSIKTAENSEVPLPVAVAVTFGGFPDTVNDHVPLPEVSVRQVVLPRYTSPSPYPEGSPAAFANKSIAKVVDAVLLNEPCTVDVPLPESKIRLVMIGKFGGY